MDFNAALQKRILPPFIPTVQSKYDVRYFDREFLDLPVHNSEDESSLAQHLLIGGQEDPKIPYNPDQISDGAAQMGGGGGGTGGFASSASMGNISMSQASLNEYPQQQNNGGIHGHYGGGGGGYNAGGNGHFVAHQQVQANSHQANSHFVPHPQANSHLNVPQRKPEQQIFQGFSFFESEHRLPAVREERGA